MRAAIELWLRGLAAVNTDCPVHRGGMTSPAHLPHVPKRLRQGPRGYDPIQPGSFRPSANQNSPVVGMSNVLKLSLRTIGMRCSAPVPERFASY